MPLHSIWLAYIPFLCSFAKGNTLTQHNDPFGGTFLRVLPLGDSITWGFLSPDLNGYRSRLHHDITSNGSSTKFVGNVYMGTMKNNANEGHIGAPITQILGYADDGLAFNPNIILLHAGTNDLVANPLYEDKYQALQRLSSLIAKCLNWKTPAGLPLNPTLLVAKIVRNADTANDNLIQQFNNGIPWMLQNDFPAAKVAVVDMSVIPASDTVDGTHPTGDAYLRMGDIWYAGMRRLVEEHPDWILAPV